MEISEAKNSLKKVTRDASSLTPTAIVSLFEIYITDLLKNNERTLFLDGSGASAYTTDGKTVLRFHNNIKLFQSSIRYDGKAYFAAPIQITGYEVNAKGSPPRPKMSISIDPEGLSQETQNRVIFIKTAIRDLDDLVGSKVTRIRTFVKYIDSENFFESDGTTLLSNTVKPPKGFDPDPNAQFPPDVYFVDRKSAETVNVLELELASPFDTQDLKLPARIVNDFTCPWTYRGEGCCYEWSQQKNAVDSVYGKSNESEGNVAHENSNLDCKTTANPIPNGSVANPNGAAPPVATYNNEIINAAIDGEVLFNVTNGQDEWKANTVYNKGDSVRVKIKGVNYYFVSKVNANSGKAPPNENFWVADQCSKTIEGCRLRWANNPELGTLEGPLPFGGFPTSRRAID